MKYCLVFIFYFVGFSVQASTLEMSIALGNSLTEAVSSKSYIKMKALDNYREVRAFLKDNKCSGFKYRAYTIEDKNKFYLIASKGKGMVIGRHFVGDISDNTVDIDSLVSSTNGCINLGAPKKDSAAMFVTHLKSEPNEFHLLESNLAKVALFVSSKGGLFSVSDGSISKIKD